MNWQFPKRNKGKRVGILTRNEKSWCSSQLKGSLMKKGIKPVCFSFKDLVARVGLEPQVSINTLDVEEIDTIIVRPIGRGSLEEIILRMDILHKLERLGKYIINSPLAIENSVDKYTALTLLKEHELPTPKTIVTENASAATKAFFELGEDVVMKPIFGSRGVGSTRITDKDVAERIFRAVNFQRQILYLQEFIPHGDYDLRILALGNRALASMKRVSATWKNNISLGAKPIYHRPSSKVESLALESSRIVGCEVAGVDIIESDEGPFIIEVNSQPGWKGLQSVTKINIADEITKHILARAG